MTAMAQAQARLGASLMARAANCALAFAGSDPFPGIVSNLPAEGIVGDYRAQSRAVSVRCAAADIESVTPAVAEGTAVAITSELPGVAGNYLVGAVTGLPNVTHSMLDLVRA